MIEIMNQEVEVVCPSCSPKKPVWHDVLKFGQNPIVKCQECEHVHSAKIEIPKPIGVKVIISRGEESFTTRTKILSNEKLYVDDEIIIDDELGDEVYPIIITSIESGDKRLDSAEAKDIDTIWGRAIDEVAVKIAVHSDKGTKTFVKKVPGGYEFVVGNEERADSKTFYITRIKIRDGNFISRKGNTVEAKYIKRIFAKEVYRRGWGGGRTAWSMKSKGRD